MSTPTPPPQPNSYLRRSLRDEFGGRLLIVYYAPTLTSDGRRLARLRYDKRLPWLDLKLTSKGFVHRLEMPALDPVASHHGLRRIDIVSAIQRHAPPL